jgi:hypothetical protein
LQHMSVSRGTRIFVKFEANAAAVENFLGG